jgi:hypothetical protein
MISSTKMGMSASLPWMGSRGSGSTDSPVAGIHIEAGVRIAVEVTGGGGSQPSKLT